MFNKNILNFFNYKLLQKINKTLISVKYFQKD